MVFWILLALTVATGIFFFIRNYRNEGLSASIIYGLFSALIAVVASLVIIAVLGGIFLSNSHVVSDTHEQRTLVSLHTSQVGKIHGESYFLGSGIIDGSTGTGYTYMYSAKDSNGSTFYQMDNASASDSRVYTLDANSKKTPSVDIETARWAYGNGWILPWSMDAGTGYAYTFYVPKNSIVQNYQAQLSQVRRGASPIKIGRGPLLD